MSSDLKSSEFLATITDVNQTDVDITNCDLEPIHIPNLIQPHGVLLAVCATEYKILQVSLNTAEMLGIESQELLGKPLSELLGEEQVRAIKGCLSEDFAHINPLPVKINRDGSNITFDGIVHRNQEIIILELEPTQLSQEVDFFNFYQLVKTPVNPLVTT